MTQKFDKDRFCVLQKYFFPVCQDPAMTGFHHHPTRAGSDSDQRLRQLELEQARLKSLHSATAVGIGGGGLSPVD